MEWLNLIESKTLSDGGCRVLFRDIPRGRVKLPTTLLITHWLYEAP